jgi:hypothetical protein
VTRCLIVKCAAGWPPSLPMFSLPSTTMSPVTAVTSVAIAIHSPGSGEKGTTSAWVGGRVSGAEPGSSGRARCACGPIRACYTPLRAIQIRRPLRRGR